MGRAGCRVPTWGMQVNCEGFQAPATQHAARLPSDQRRTAKRAAVQDHRGPRRKSCRTVQLRAAGGQVEKEDGVTLSVDLQERHKDGGLRKGTGLPFRSTGNLLSSIRSKQIPALRSRLGERRGPRLLERAAPGVSKSGATDSALPSWPCVMFLGLINSD